MAKPPSSLPPSSIAPLRVSLLLGSFVHGPAALDLFDLHVPPSASAPVYPDEFYHLRPELAHTFRPDPKLPPRFVSAFFAALVLAPWVVLFALWGAVTGLLLWYWVEFRLGHILLYGSGAAALALLAGKQALVGIAARRTGSSK
ncbi:hypothetical protein EDB83DRAFT_2516025 [Lactarius deliciosus]|nr:hypothetical protein EDB83DRAFT_2516025 [Lactarius deliciosus]